MSFDLQLVPSPSHSFQQFVDIIEPNVDECDICTEPLQSENLEVITYRYDCQHRVHKVCVQDYFKNLILENQLEKIQCLHCPPIEVGPEQVNLARRILNNEYFEKYKVICNNRIVAKSKGRVYHCPVPDCKGLINSDKYQLFQLKVACDFCKKDVCSTCKKLWHEGVNCIQTDGDELDWDQIGDGRSGQAHRCPKCNAAIEKSGGCPHMKCLICNHQWCWVCGLQYNTTLHNSLQAVCNTLSTFSLNPKYSLCTKICVEMFCFIFWPVIFGVIHILIYLALILNYFFIRVNLKCEPNHIFYTFCKFILVLIILLVMMSIGFIVFTLSYILLVIPSWAGIAYILVRKNLNWIPYRHYFKSPVKQRPPETSQMEEQSSNLA